MHLDRRETLQLFAAAALAGFGRGGRAQTSPYDQPPPFRGPGQVSLLHLTDCHAQLLPGYFREPSVNIGVGAQAGQWPHLVGAAALQAARVERGSPMAHALTYLDFELGASRFGRIGGFAHLATLVKRLKASRPGALLLDGGDTWQGSATALWSRGQDMVDAALLLGVDVMTGHWEFTYGQARVQQVVDGDFKGRIEFLAQNVRTADFGDAVFAPYTLREINAVPVAIIGQAYPYTPIAHPRDFVADWSFGIREEDLQKAVDEVRAKGAQLVLLLSHNGMDVDLKLASRVAGIDAILGGHTHDAVPVPVRVANRGGHTLVTNAGCNGKFLGVLDLQVKNGRLADSRYTLLPVFADLLPPDAAMAALIERVRAPHAARLGEKLATTDGLLFRRGNFNGSWDQLLCDALRAVHDAPIALSPGFRWGGTLLPGQAITREDVFAQTAITYPATTVTVLTGAQIKDLLEDVADNLFNPDPYYRQGGDMVRSAGLSYTCAPLAAMGSRIGDLRGADGRLLDAGKTYKVAGWAPVAESARGGRPMWELVEEWLKAQRGSVAVRRVETPRLIGVEGDPGLSV